MGKFKILRTFKPEELILSEEETRVVLRFFFKNNEGFIDTIPITDAVRGFAQAILIEAIDASYALGFVEAIFKGGFNAPKGAIKILKNFAKKAALHWFKHAKANDLQDMQIYELVRKEIERRFMSSLVILVRTALLKKGAGAFVAYNKSLSCELLKVWG